MKKLKFFQNFVSNTCAGSSNQHVFHLPENTVKTGRIFYKIFCGGKYNYSLLFSNITDSTFADGRDSHMNMICPEWEILGAKIGRADKNFFEGCNGTAEAERCVNGKDLELFPVTFNKSKTKTVAPGEFFCSDPVTAEFCEGEYLCLEITFRGTKIPYHEETLLPVFGKCEEGFVYDKKMPFASMVGCDRNVRGRIAFWGDSITQGIGTPMNSYTHWNALLSEKIGADFAFWNLGIGFARANDSAADGAWAYKAKQNDVVFVCFGVNDLLQDFSEKQIIHDIEKTVDILLKENIKVVLQTLPPFNYDEQKRVIWENVNRYIKDVLSKKVSFVFDNGTVLSESAENPHMTRFGGHPDEEGCDLWAKAIYESIRNENFIEDIGWTKKHTTE